MNKTLIREKEKYRTTHPYTNVVSSSEKSVLNHFHQTSIQVFLIFRIFYLQKKFFFNTKCGVKLNRRIRNYVKNYLKKKD